MVFTVTYRGKDGALHDEVIDAADRAGCVAECRKRGISPTKIVEGGKGKDRDKRGTSRVGAGGDSKRTTARWVAVAVLAQAEDSKRTTASGAHAAGGGSIDERALRKGRGCVATSVHEYKRRGDGKVQDR